MRYTRVRDEEELLEALSDPGATILCGGTDLLVRMRAGTLTPSHLVDISSIASLRGLCIREGWLEIGAATPVSEVMRSPLVQTHAPLLVTALRQLGSVQIRNRASIGGNLVNASPAADSVVPLLLYDAEVHVSGRGGSRWTRIEDFLVGPGKTRCATGEVVRAIRLPQTEIPAESFYHKIGRRNALTIAIASVAMLAWAEEDSLLEVRLAAGSVAPTPVRLRTAEKALTGRRLTDDAVEDALAHVQSIITPISDVRAPATYRAQAVTALIRRALGKLKH